MNKRLFLYLFLFSLYISANSQPKPYGSGNFGNWTTDESGLPAYDFKPGSTDKDFLHLLGNEYCDALAHGGGYVDLWSSRFSFKVYNCHIDNNYSGGFGWVNDNGKKWSTLYVDRPAGSDYRILFGMGYVRKTVVCNDLEVVQKIFVPEGKDEVIMEELEFINHSSGEKNIDYFDYWDVAVAKTDGRLLYRDSVKTYFDPERAALKAVMTGKHGDFTRPSENDPSKMAIFVSILNTSVEKFDTKQDLFFGNGSRKLPERVSTGNLLNITDTSGTLRQDKAVLATQINFTIAPKGRKRIFVLYGASLKGGENKIIDYYRASYDNKFTELIEKNRNVKLTLTPEYNWIAREMTWNNYYLMAGMLREEYFKTSSINQTGQYFFVNGYNIALRDPLQHLMPLSYTCPDYAKSTLKYVMRCMRKNGKLDYGSHAFGMVDDYKNSVFGPSDQQFYLFWSVYDYLCATRDWSFLDEKNKYYDGDTATVYEMLKTAYYHVLNITGKGEHGVIRVGKGDWADDFLTCAGNRKETISRGESTMNQALASFTYPLLKEIAIRMKDTSFAKKIKTEIEDVNKILNSVCWKGKFYNRGWVIDSANKVVEVGANYAHLEPNSFALMADGLMTDNQADSLVEFLRDDNASLNCGISMVNPASHPRYLLTDAVWVSPSHATIQGLIKNSGRNSVAKALAWTEFRESTLARHAELWPDLYYGIINGPDHFLPESGETQSWMPFPQLIMHNHSQELFSSIRLAGIWPDIDGYKIDPAFPFDSYTWESSYVGVTYSRDKLSGFIKSSGNDMIIMRVRIPGNFEPEEVIADNSAVSFSQENKFLIFKLKVEKDNVSHWEIMGKKKLNTN